MSRLTLLMIAALFALPAQAGSVIEDAQSRRGKAFNDFYNNYKTSQHRPEDVQAISSQTIAPSSQQITRALAAEKAQALKGAGVKSMTQSEADAEVKRLKQEAEEAAANGGDSDEDRDGNTDGKPAKSGAAAESGEKGGAGKPAAQGQVARKPAPEPVIDGKAIPKEITFGGKK